MPSSSNEPTTELRDLISQLQTPIHDVSILISHLSAPLGSLGLLLGDLKKYNASPLPSSTGLIKHIPALQRAVLQHVLPAWADELAKRKLSLLADLYFCPENSQPSPATSEIVLQAYSTLVALPFDNHSIRLLALLAQRFNVDAILSFIFSAQPADPIKQEARWEDSVRNILAVPAKAANAAATLQLDIPEQLQVGLYFHRLSVTLDEVIASTPSIIPATALAFLLTKLVNQGAFPPALPSLPSQPSFFYATLPQIRLRLLQWNAKSYSDGWQAIFSALPSTSTLRRVLVSLLSHLPELQVPLDARPGQRSLVRTEGWLLRGLVGAPSRERTDLWDAVTALLVGKQWNEYHARIVVCWVAGAQVDAYEEEALDTLLSNVLDIWSSPEHVKYSLVQRHQFMTSLFLLTVCSFPPSASSIERLAMNPTFISGVGAYISHLDQAVRRCGMLAAEVVAAKAGKTLNFGDWEGDGPGKDWVRDLRPLLSQRDADAEPAERITEDATTAEAPAAQSEEVSPPVPSAGRATVQVIRPGGHDSDDSLTGYDSPVSSRASSPTPSELEEIEKDPTIHVGRKKIPRPVYLAQLGELLRPSTGQKYDEQQEADMMEMALTYAEELIRKKRDYGFELEENAVNLAFGLIGLANNYELNDFNARRQSALNALVACCPQKAAPTITQEFFSNQYSADQRYTMLNALAIGARELASLPIPPSQVAADRVAFASKRLPPAQHRKYITLGDELTNPMRYMLEDVNNQMVTKAKESGEDRIPQAPRERQLRIRQPARVIDVTNAVSSSNAPLQETLTKQRTTFTTVAAQYFIYPLVNRFWTFLREEQVREERTAHLPTLQQYRGAGTGLILSPLILSHFLGTLSVLMHAARNAPEWGAVLAPDVLELALTLGTRPVSMLEAEEGAPERASLPAGNDAETRAANVLSAALELALIVVDGCVDLDGGRALGLEHTVLLLGVGDWAQAVLSRLDKGERVKGGGGIQEVKLSRAAAALVLKVDEVTSRWKRSMLNLLEM